MVIFNNLPLVFLIVILTSINNWVVPIVIYACKFDLFKKRPAGFVGCNFWGVIMDVFLASAINLVITNLLILFWEPISGKNLLTSLIISFSITVLLHIWMAVKPWKVWIMPKPWHWNLAGIWHWFSMTIQFAYGFYLLVILAHNPARFLFPENQISLFLAAVLGAVFLWCVQHDKVDHRLGPIKISGKPW